MTMELGGNITLTGFKEIAKSELVVVKKIVGTYAKKLTESVPDFTGLKVTMKKIHQVENSERYEFHASVSFGGKHFESKEEDRNVFVGLDSVLQNVTDHVMREEEKMRDR